MDMEGFVDVSVLMHCGIYALLRRGQVVYVGKSKKPLVRLYSHFNARGKPSGHQVGQKPTIGISFDAIRFLPCMLGQLDVLEVKYIKMWEPKHNVKDKPKAVKIPLPEDIRELLRVLAPELPPSRDCFQGPVGPFIPRRL